LLYTIENRTLQTGQSLQSRQSRKQFNHKNMKKKIFLVGALVAFAMGAMFISCDGGDLQNGCTCDMTSNDGSTFTTTYTQSEMEASYGASSCGELLTKIVESGAYTTARCRN